MCQAGAVVRNEQTTPDRILAAAFTVFSSRSVAGASMALIAKEAGISRPALYQYFDDKVDIYRAMLEDVLNRSASQAISALDEAGSVRSALSGFIDNSWGGKELWSLRRHQGQDLAAAKAGPARPTVEAHYQQLITAMRRYLKPHAESKTQLDGWIDIIRYSPLGFDYDQPSRAVYRKRLAALAGTLADSIDASSAVSVA